MICRLETSKKFDSAVASDYPIDGIIQEDKKYGYYNLPNGELTYRFHGEPPKGLLWWEVEKAIHNAVKRYVPYIKDFKRVRPARTGETALFNIYCKKTSEDPNLTQNTIMYIYYPMQTPHLNRGVCVINRDFWYSVNGKSISAHFGDPDNYPDPNTKTTFSTIDFDKVFAHELGHGWLGLPHDPLNQNIMTAYETKMSEFLSERDIARAQAKAGKRNLTAQYVLAFMERLKIYSNR